MEDREGRDPLGEALLRTENALQVGRGWRRLCRGNDPEVWAGTKEIWADKRGSVGGRDPEGKDPPCTQARGPVASVAARQGLSRVTETSGLAHPLLLVSVQGALPGGEENSPPSRLLDPQSSALHTFGSRMSK